MVWERGKVRCVFRISFPDLCTMLSCRPEQVPYELLFLQAGRLRYEEKETTDCLRSSLNAKLGIFTS